MTIDMRRFPADDLILHRCRLFGAVRTPFEGFDARTYAEFLDALDPDDIAACDPEDGSLVILTRFTYGGLFERLERGGEAARAVAAWLAVGRVDPRFAVRGFDPVETEICTAYVEKCAGLDADGKLDAAARGAAELEFGAKKFVGRNWCGRRQFACGTRIVFC